MADTQNETVSAPVPSKLEEDKQQQQQPTATDSAPDPKPHDIPAPTADPDNEPAAAKETATETQSARVATPTSIDIDSNKPQDFDGEILTTNELPSAEIQKLVENHVLLDQHGKTHTFKSLYTGRNVARRVLVIFVRHFFCGNCQEYLRTLSEEITPESLLRLPISTFITVIGCGDPALIDMYVKATGCQFPVYTDPKGALFEALGMIKTLSMGTKPAYQKKSVPKGIFDSIVQGLKFVPKGLALKSGDQRQVGGEFLYEPFDIVTPVTTPQDEHNPHMGSLADQGHTEMNAVDERVEEKKITWAHRMKTTRDHAEMPELKEVLGLTGVNEAGEASRTRKGTGLSMASQMSQLHEAALETAPPAEPVIQEAK